MRRVLVLFLGVVIGLVAFYPNSRISSASTNSVACPAVSPDLNPTEVYTGTIVAMNTRMASTGFTLYIKNYTPDEDVKRYLGILAEGDQDDLLKAIRNIDLGNIAVTGQTGRQINVARKSLLPDGRTRIAIAFERWLRFNEVRNGYRSEDYPFGIMEFFLDEKGKGSGTYITAASVDLKHDKKTGQDRLEIENFATYPNKVMGVMNRTKKS
jgi:hypothetical protein